MSSTESLLFKISVTSTGLNPSQIDAFTKSLQALSNIKLTGNVGPVFNELNSQLKTGKTSADAFTSSITKVGTATGQMGNNVKQAVSSVTTLDAEIKKLQSDNAKTAASLDATAASLTRQSAGFKANAAAATANAAELKKVVTTNEQVGTSATSAAAQTARIKAQLEASGAAAAANAAEGRKVVTTNEQIAASATQVGSSMNLSRGAMKAGAQEMTNYISRAAGMFISVVGLTQAVQESVGMQEASTEAQANAAQAHAKYNALLESGTATQKELTKAKEEMAKADRAQTVITRNAAFAYSDQLYFVSLLGVELVSVLIPAYTRLRKAQADALASGTTLNALDLLTGKFKGLGAAISAGFSGTTLVGFENFTGKLQKSISPTEKFVASVKGIAPGMATAIPVSSRFGIALGTVARGLLIASPVIAAVTAGIAAYATNAFGARDAANQFGASIGNTLQIFKPFGELLVGIAGKLGLTGESADQVAIHFEKAGQGFANMSTLWHNTIQGLITSSDEFSQKVGQNLLKASDAVTTMSADFVRQLGMTGDAWSTFIDQLSKKDYKGAVDSIGVAFAALPGIITTAISDFGDLMDGLWGTIQPSLNQLGTNIMGILGELGKRISDKFWSELQNAFNNLTAVGGFFTEIGKRIGDDIWKGLQDALKNLQTLGDIIVKGFGDISAQIQAWVKTNITDPINGFITYIKVTAADIWAQITGGTASVVSAVTAWVNQNIVKPINDLPGQIVEQASAILKALGIGITTQDVSNWMTVIADQLMALPKYIQEQASAIVGALLKGDYNAQILSFVKGVAAQLIDGLAAQLKNIPVVGDALADAVKNGASALGVGKVGGMATGTSGGTGSGIKTGQQGTGKEISPAEAGANAIGKGLESLSKKQENKALLRQVVRH